MSPRQEQGPGKRGSLKWIQRFVNDQAGALDAAIASSSDGRISTPIDWRSPLADDDFAEYWDAAFLDLLEVAG